MDNSDKAEAWKDWREEKQLKRDVNDMEPKSKAVKETREAFYKVAIQQRDSAWREIEELKKEIEELNKKYLRS